MKHILINSEKINSPEWGRWMLLLGAYSLSMVCMSLAERLAAYLLHVNIANVLVYTYFLRAFIGLTLINDLTPRFRKSISTVWSLLMIYLYFTVDRASGDRLYLGALYFMIGLIIYNTLLFYREIKLRKLAQRDAGEEIKQ